MNVNKKSSVIVIGLALFSMFFGSGNLIFPLYIGQVAEGDWLATALGFVITAVFVPFLGVVAMVAYKGNYTKFFSCLGKPVGLLMTALVLTVWIPLGSAPRCIVLAHSSLSTHFSTPPLWIFSIAYCGLVSLVIYQKKRMLDILGYFLTPALLACLGIIIFKAITASHEMGAAPYSEPELFLTGLKEGYNTMDLIASFFFSASIIEILRQLPHGSNFHPLKITLRASLIGISLLAAVYIGMIHVAASYAEILQNVPKDQLLAQISHHVLGGALSSAAVVAIFLACFTTSVALVIVYSEFLHQTVFKGSNSDKSAILITLIASFAMSIFGLNGITFITEPILQIFYPILISLIIWNLSRKLFKYGAAQHEAALVSEKGRT